MEVVADQTVETSTEISRGETFFENHCRCALDGDNGFCGTVLGTGIYKENIAVVKSMLERSNCHTLDRNDLLAQRDTCGIGMTIEWEAAVSSLF